MMRDFRVSRTIELTEAQADLIKSVLGQMSDGYWENYSPYEPIWRNIRVSGNNLEMDVVNLSRESSWYERTFKAYLKYLNKDCTDSDIKNWFAGKADIVNRADLRWRHGSSSIKGHENEHAKFLDSRRNKNVNQTYGDIKLTIKSLKK